MLTPVQALRVALATGAQGAPLVQYEEALAGVVSKDYPGLRDVNEVAAVLARKQSARLVGDISATKRKVVASLVAKAIDNGWSDSTLADRIAEKVGLDQRYAQAVENFRGREQNKNRPKGVVAREVQAYADRLRQHRAMVIAKNEVQAVLLDAQRALWTQQQQDGDVSRYAVRVTHIHKDERLCRICRTENGKRRSLRKDAAGGPPLHVSCRCYEVLDDQGIAKADPSLWGDGPDEIKKEQTVAISKGENSLDRSPKKNWVENQGGLPAYIDKIANDLHTERGMPISRAIAVAISRVKLWSVGGGGVKPDTKAKSLAALAEWEAMKAKSHAKDAAK